MTNVEALKNLYVALGGSAEDVANLDSNAAIINLLGNVAGGIGLVVNANNSDSKRILDKTFAEIESAMMAGRLVVVVTSTSETTNSVAAVIGTTRLSARYVVGLAGGDVFNASAQDGYPEADA